MKGKVLKQLWSPKWHKTCRLHYNNQMLQRAQKREHGSPERDGAPRKCSRLHSSQPSEVSCFFCGQAAGTDGLHEVTTFQVDQRVRKSAELTRDSFLLAKLSLGDMVALEAIPSAYWLSITVQRKHSKEHIVKMTKYQELYLLNL